MVSMLSLVLVPYNHGQFLSPDPLHANFLLKNQRTTTRTVISGKVPQVHAVSTDPNYRFAHDRNDGSIRRQCDIVLSDIRLK